MKLNKLILVLLIFISFSQVCTASDSNNELLLLAAVDTRNGPPPCGKDGKCNYAACANDPDCPIEKPDKPAKPRRTSDIKDCSSAQTNDIGFAIDWGADNWSEFEAALENIRDWPVNIGNCLKNRFKKNGKVVCEDKMKGKCKGANGWASALNKKCHMCPDFLDKIKGISGVENRQACYFALVTHEWGHTCERGHKTLEIIDDEAFDFWKKKHPGVTINFSDCGMK